LKRVERVFAGRCTTTVTIADGGGEECLQYAIGTVRSAGIVRVSSCGDVNAADLGDAIAAPGVAG